MSLASVGFETGSYIRPDPKDYESPFQDQRALEIQIKKGTSKTRPFLNTVSKSVDFVFDVEILSEAGGSCAAN